jgi:hypothetical protein
LDPNSTFSDTAKVGDPLFQPPEVLCAHAESTILYSPAGVRAVFIANFTDGAQNFFP